MINPFVKTVVSSIAGTTMMTASSALMSLIGQDLESLTFKRFNYQGIALYPKKARSLSAWAAHYAMGAAFSAVYVKLWEAKKLKPTATCGLTLGAASGLIGIAIWKATFAAHPLSPLMNYKRFYLQRIPAHIVFAIFATIAYQVMQKQEEPKNDIEKQGSIELS